MSRQSDLERRIQGLDPKAFEALVFDLVLSQHSGANAMAAPDGGADVVVAANGERRALVWQAKRHVPRIHFQACEKSLRNALASYNPEEVVFVFAKDLTANEARAFDSRLRQAGAQSGTDVSYWGLSALRARLQDNPRLRVRHLSHDEQTLLDIFSSQRSGASFLERTFGLRDMLDAEDPAYKYTVELQPNAFAPKFRPTDKVTLVASDGDQHLRLAAKPRDPGAGPIIKWQFTNDEAGALAREQALLAVARGDEEVTVEAGFEADVEAAPKAMRESAESTLFETQVKRVIFKPGPAIPLKVTALNGATETSHRELSLYPFPPSGAFTHCYVGLSEGFMPFLGFQVARGDSGIQVAFAPMLELGDNAHENAAATRFNLDLFGADDLLLAGPLFPEHLTRGGPMLPLMPERVLELTEYWNAVYESVVYLENELGARIPVHPPPFTPDELSALNDAAEILRSREFDGTFREAEMHAPSSSVEQSIAFIRSHPTVTFPVMRDVFGTRIELGRAVARLPQVHAIELPSSPATSGATTTIKVISKGDGEMHCQLLAPGESAPPNSLNLPASE